MPTNSASTEVIIIDTVRVGNDTPIKMAIGLATTRPKIAQKVKASYRANNTSINLAIANIPRTTPKPNGNRINVGVISAAISKVKADLIKVLIVVKMG